MKYTLITQSEKITYDEYKLLHVEVVKGDMSHKRHVEDNAEKTIHQAICFDSNIELTYNQLKRFHTELLADGLGGIDINYHGEIDVVEEYSAIDAYCDDVPENVIRMMYKFANFSDIYSHSQLSKFFTKLQA